MNTIEGLATCKAETLKLSPRAVIMALSRGTSCSIRLVANAKPSSHWQPWCR